MEESNTLIIGFAGRKGSGKDTSAKELADVLNLTLMLKGYNNERVKVYHFADQIKEICINILGLPRDKCYGTDADKSEFSQLYWENMPGVTTPEQLYHIANLPMDYLNSIGILVHEPGQMTIREVMQFVGTEIFRRMYSEVWIDALMRQIKQEKKLVALIADVRFLNEIEAIKNNSGQVIKLLRSIDSNDNHASEAEIDQYNPDGYTIDNRNLSIKETNKLILSMFFKIQDENRKTEPISV